MKIEKISDTQIRCTLNKDDLVDRQLRISELAYGTEKAKNLFRDMMQQANCEFGFEADDIPLMIEAIPVSPECLVLVITKIDDPDELDTRFSRFTSSPSDDSDSEESYGEDILNCFDQLNDMLDSSEEIHSDGEDELTALPETLEIETIEKEEQEPAEHVKEKKKTAVKSPSTDLVKVFSFATLKEATNLSRLLFHVYKGKNTLFKDTIRTRYYLVIHKTKHTPEEFNKICNIISEYGKSERTTYASSAYFEEHYEVIIRDKAMKVLSKM